MCAGKLSCAHEEKKSITFQDLRSSAWNDLSLAPLLKRRPDRRLQPLMVLTKRFLSPNSPLCNYSWFLTVVRYLYYYFFFVLFVCFAWCAPLHSHWLELILTQGLSQAGDAAAVTTTLTLNLNKKAFLRWLNEVWVSLAVFIVKLLKTSFLWNTMHNAPCVFTMHQFIYTILSNKMPII